MQITETVYDVVVDGRKVASGVDEVEAQRVKREHPGAQTRTRGESRTVPAKFAVYVNGKRVGEAHDDPGAAAKEAKRLNGIIKLVAA